MSEQEELKPDVNWLKSKFVELRTARGVASYPGRFPERFQGELVLLEVDAQQRYIETLERSIKSQDELAETQKRMAKYSLYLAGAEVFVGFVAAWIGWVAFQAIL